MKNKGFTLLELLGVIIILAILVTLSFPSIINFIKSSTAKKDKIINDLIISAAESYISDNSEDLYITSGNDYCVTVDELIETQYLGSISELDEYQKVSKSVKVTYDNGYKYEIVDSKKCSICKLISNTSNAVGSKYECEVKPGTKYNFYVLSTEADGTANLIMERNICEDGSLATVENKCTVAWISDSDYGCINAGDSCALTDKGPITAMNYLNKATSTWENIPNLNILYDDEGGNFTNFPITGKARLPYDSELTVASAEDKSTAYLYDYLNDSGHQSNIIEGVGGYWSLSSFDNSIYDDDYNTDCAWAMYYNGVGYYDLSTVSGGLWMGVRPVINIKLDGAFSGDSWDTIAANVRSGNLSSYNVGDEKKVTLTGEVEGTYTVRIANISTPDECNSEGFSQTACGLVIEFKDVITNYHMNSEDTNAGGWEASEMRTYVNSTIYNSLPEDLKRNIINTYVVSGHEAGKMENYKTIDKIYLLSTKEVWGKEDTSNVVNYDTAEAETRQLDYYKMLEVTTDNNYFVADKSDLYEGHWWWLRSAYSDYDNSFYDVGPYGDLSVGIAYDINGVSVAFRVG